MVLSQSSFSQHMSSLFIPMSKSETQERNWASSHLSHFFPSVPSACFPNRSQILALCLFSGLKLHHISPVLSQATSEIFFFLPLWSPLELILCRAPKILLFTKICIKARSLQTLPHCFLVYELLERSLRPVRVFPLKKILAYFCLIMPTRFSFIFSFLVNCYTYLPNCKLKLLFQKIFLLFPVHCFSFLYHLSASLQSLFIVL